MKDEKEMLVSNIPNAAGHRPVRSPLHSHNQESCMVALGVPELGAGIMLTRDLHMRK